MLYKRKDLINKFLQEGFTYRTLSLFSDKQLNKLSQKLFNEQVTDKDIKDKEKELATLYMAKAAELEETNEDEEVELTPNNEPITKVEKDGKEMTLLGDGELGEEAVSQSQYNFYQLVHACKKSKYKDCGDGRNDNAVLKAAKDMTYKQIEDYTKTKNTDSLPTKVSEQEMLESWVMSLVESNLKPEISKKEFLKTIKETVGKKTIKEGMGVGTPEQEESFNMVVELGNEMEPPMEVIIDGFEDDGHLNGYLKSIEQNIDLNICPQGNIKLGGNPIGEIELSETERDDEGEYIGAPVDTTAPVKTPTIAPTKPGEKKRRGPFQKPKVKPKPKASKNDSPLPDWLTSTNLGKSLTQHG